MLNKAVLYRPKNVTKTHFKRHYFRFWDLLNIYFYETCCCCFKNCKPCKKKSKKRAKYIIAKEKLDKDLDIIENNHAKHRMEVLENILIQPYQKTLIPIAMMVQLDRELESRDNNTITQDSEPHSDKIEDEKEKVMSTTEAADKLVQRMENIKEMNFIENQLNAWLISILDIDLKNNKGKKSKFSINEFDLSVLEKLNLRKFIQLNAQGDGINEFKTPTPVSNQL